MGTVPLALQAKASHAGRAVSRGAGDVGQSQRHNVVRSGVLNEGLLQAGDNSNILTTVHLRLVTDEHHISTRLP